MKARALGGRACAHEPLFPLILRLVRNRAARQPDTSGFRDLVVAIRIALKSLPGGSCSFATRSLSWTS
jgi:hypothetical protein